MEIGLYFGSFNPIHIGHLIIAESMLELTNLKQIWFVVSPQNPFKKNDDLLHDFDRLAMVERAIAENSRFKACDVEFQLPKPSYTVDTLDVLQNKYPEHNFSLIIGQDNLTSFNKWKNYEAILAKFHLYVYPRPNAKTSTLEEHPSISVVSSPLFDISATYIRKQLSSGKSVKYLLPEGLEYYIQQKKFYI